MKLSIDKVNDITVVTPLAQSLDANNFAMFKAQVSPVFEESKKVIIDLSMVQDMDSTGLGAILSCVKTSKQMGGTLKLCGLSRQVRSLCELVRMNQIMDIFNTKEEALRG